MNYIKIILENTASNGLSGRIVEGFDSFKRYNRGKNSVKVELKNFELDPGEHLEAGFVQCNESGQTSEAVETVSFAPSLMSTTGDSKVYVAKVPDELFVVDAEYYLIELRRVGDDWVDSASVGPVPVSARSLTREGTEPNVGDFAAIQEKVDEIQEAIDDNNAYCDNVEERLQEMARKNHIYALLVEPVDGIVEGNDSTSPRDGVRVGDLLLYNSNKLYKVMKVAYKGLEEERQRVLTCKLLFDPKEYVSKDGDEMSGILRVRQDLYRAAMAPAYGGFELSFSEPNVSMSTYYGLEKIERRRTGASIREYAFPGVSGSLVVKEGLSLNFTVDENFVMKVQLINEGNVLSEQSVDLPLESVVVDGKYDESMNSIILTLQNGTELSIPVPNAVDMSEYVKIDAIEDGSGILYKNGKMSIDGASKALISLKQNVYRPITPATSDHAVKEGVVNSTEEWTDEDKTKARALFGAIGITDYATISDFGVVKPYGSGLYGIAVQDGGLYVRPANNASIDSRFVVENPAAALSSPNSRFMPIVPATIDYAVKSVLTKPLLELTDEEKSLACEWLGAVPKSVSKTSELLGQGTQFYVIKNGEIALGNVSMNNVPFSVPVRETGNQIAVGKPTSGHHATPRDYVVDGFVAQIKETATKRRVYGIAEDGSQAVFEIITTGTPASGNIPIYNGAGRLQTNAPEWGSDCVNKEYADNGFVAKQTATSNQGTLVYAFNASGDFALSVNEGAYGNTVARRTASGTLKAKDGTEDDDLVTFKQLSQASGTQLYQHKIDIGGPMLFIISDEKDAYTTLQNVVDAIHFRERDVISDDGLELLYTAHRISVSTDYASNVVAVGVSDISNGAVTVYIHHMASDGSLTKSNWSWSPTAIRDTVTKL